MDLSIRLITPEYHENCGAQAFDEGLAITEHNMNPGSVAIKYFENGWHRQRVLRSREALVLQLAEACPP